MSLIGITWIIGSSLSSSNWTTVHLLNISKVWSESRELWRSANNTQSKTCRNARCCFITDLKRRFNCKIYADTRRIITKIRSNSLLTTNGAERFTSFNNKRWLISTIVLNLEADYAEGAKLLAYYLFARKLTFSMINLTVLTDGCFRLSGRSKYVACWADIELFHL